MNKYTGRKAVCSVIALMSNESQAGGKVPLGASGSCADPVTAHVYLFLAADTPFYTVHQRLRHLQGLTSLITPKSFWSLQMAQVLGLSLGGWGVLVIAGLRQPHLSVSVPSHTTQPGLENEEWQGK